MFVFESCSTSEKIILKYLNILHGLDISFSCLVPDTNYICIQVFFPHC